MRHFTNLWSNQFFGYSHFKNKFQILVVTCFVLLGLTSQAKAQVEPEVIKGWNNLEEADFLFDVSYRIVKCNPLAPAEIHLLAFNEGGNVDAVGFDLLLKDEKGNEARHKVEKFEISLGTMLRADCGNDSHSFLKFALPEGLNVNTLTIEITYNK